MAAAQLDTASDELAITRAIIEMYGEPSNGAIAMGEAQQDTIGDEVPSCMAESKDQDEPEREAYHLDATPLGSIEFLMALATISRRTTVT